MVNLLVEFVGTLDLTLKKHLQYIGSDSGIAKLTISQMQYIDAVHTIGIPTVTQVAEKMKVSKASTTNAIHKLCSSGYLVKTRSSEDRRVFHVSLTDTSRQMVSSRDKALTEYSEFISATLTPEENKQLRSILAKIVQRYDEKQAF